MIDAAALAQAEAGSADLRRPKVSLFLFTAASFHFSTFLLAFSHLPYKLLFVRAMVPKFGSCLKLSFYSFPTISLLSELSL